MKCVRMQTATGNYYANDKIATDYCGMALNEYGWWYIKNGDVDFTYTGMHAMNTAGGISTTDSLIYHSTVLQTMNTEHGSTQTDS